MNNNNYLIPANSKKSQLILSIFTVSDLILFLVGLAISTGLLLSIKTTDTGLLILLASPALIAAFLVAPIPNYHNVRTLLRNMYKFAVGRKKYYWRGWCVCNANNRKK